jgi:hypothetical protein
MSEKNMFSEKRIHPRVPMEFPVKYRLIEAPMESGSISEMRKREVNTQTMNVSLGGMYIVAEQRLDKGSIITLNFSLPNKPGNLSAFGEVVWTNNYGGGVHFLALKEEDMKILQTTLEKVSARV